MSTLSTNQVLAANLRALMEKQKIVQTALAKKSGIGQTTISLYLNPERRQPSASGKTPSAKLTEVEALATALEVTVADLLTPGLSTQAAAGREDKLEVRWPFKRVSETKLRALSDTQREQIEEALLAIAHGLKIDVREPRTTDIGTGTI